MLVFAATGFAFTPSQHFVDGEPVFFGAQVETRNPFEYKILIFNDSDEAKNFTVEERISRELTLETASHAYSTIALGEYNRHVFDSVSIPADSSLELRMVFRNNSPEIQQTASINTKFIPENPSEPDPGISEFELFVFNLQTPAIPEFPSVLAPVMGVLGIAFMINSRRKKP